MLSYLIAEDTDAAGPTDFVVPEPYRGQASWNGQNAGLADRHHGLADERDPEAIGIYAKHLYPGTDGGPERADDHRTPEALKFHSYIRLFAQVLMSGNIRDSAQ